MFSIWKRNEAESRVRVCLESRSRSRLGSPAWFVLAVVVVIGLIRVHAQEAQVRPDGSDVLVTNVAQFRSLPAEAFLGRCGFQLRGIVTLLEPGRNLLVLQDETGAVALHPKVDASTLGIQPGQRVSLEGARCFPYVVVLPDFPYQPAEVGLRPSFEAPWIRSEYFLARMRGFLHPPETGEYTFWIASDNSSELWLSSSDDPAKVKRIAFESRYSWVAPHDWSHYPSQRSASIFLRAGEAYYIEAFHEQTTRDNHVAVAWQGPSVPQGVIEGRYLTPWPEGRAPSTNGVLREYWTNFSAGTLTPLAGPRPFESALSVDELRVTPEPGTGAAWPQSLAVDKALQPRENFPWVEVSGNVMFTGRDNQGGLLEMLVGETQILVRTLSCDDESLRRFRNATVRVEGVCEGVADSKGVLFPGLIWVTRTNQICVVEAAKTNSAERTAAPFTRSAAANTNPVVVGFFGVSGVVTFNDQIFGQDAMFIQEDTTVIFVSHKDREFGKQFEVGHGVELGGGLNPGKNYSTLSPLVMSELGWRAMPAPMTQPVTFPVPGNRDGRWTEVAGVAHTVNSNGTITLMAGGGPLAVWIGKTATNTLQGYVDASLRVRGVLSLTLLDTPLLLVPSPSFVDVEREAPGNPFAARTRPVSESFANGTEPSMAHRVKLSGRVTLRDGRAFFMQDASGGVRVLPADERELSAGQAVEVVGFPTLNGAVRTLTEALVRPAGGVEAVSPQALNAGEGISFQHAGTLVRLNANLISQWSADGRRVLELQEKQRVFEAELALENTELPAFEPGSRLQIVGVCDFAAVTPASTGVDATESPSTGALKIRVRSPADVLLLSGPPWWTWKHTAVLVGTLLAVTVVSLLRFHLLRRRLERHLAFSRQILESQESERRRIAVNLHDSLGQNLLVIKNQARLAMQPVADQTALQQRLDKISNCASQAIEEVREITHALRPYQLDRLGLTQTIRATVNRAAEHSSIQFASFVDEIDGVFDQESEIHVYRIVQEAVNNILKHSAATEATVVVKRLAAAVSMSIRDNGRGFDVASVDSSNSHDVGHGLNGIKERTRILGGTLVIDSRPGSGANLGIEIPVPVPEHEHEAA